jgi:Bacterial Ig-like domain
VTETSPPRLQQPPSVSKTANVTAKFSEPVKNVTTETFFLERKIAAKVKNEPPKFERVAATVDLKNGIYVLNPVKDLPKGDYRVTITTAVTDLAEPPNALAAPVVWTFTVPK